MPGVADVPERVIEVEVCVDGRKDRTVRQLARRLDLEVRAGSLKVPFDDEDGVAADDDPPVRQTLRTLRRIRNGGVETPSAIRVTRANCLSSTTRVPWCRLAAWRKPMTGATIVVSRNCRRSRSKCASSS